MIFATPVVSSAIRTDLALCNLKKVQFSKALRFILEKKRTGDKPWVKGFDP